MKKTIMKKKLLPSAVNPAAESILMRIPIEVRSQILGYLLPNLSEIKVFDGYYPYAEIFDKNAYDDFRSASERYYRRSTHEAVDQCIRSAVQYRFDAPGTEAHWRSIQKVKLLRRIPFHMAKQIQIEYWADRFFDHKDNLFHNLLGFCRILQRKPRLKNIRIDLYDESYRPKPSIANRHGRADTDGPCPPQDTFRGEILDGSFQRTEEEVNFWRQSGLANPKRCKINVDSELWEQAAGQELKSRRTSPGSGFKDTKGLEEALEPLKALKSVGRASINLTPGAKENLQMVADAKMLEDSMMNKCRRDEVDLVTYFFKEKW